MKATDFDLSREIRFSPECGIRSFRNGRSLILDADALALLRQKLPEGLGGSKTREFFLKFGYQRGYSDFMQMKINYTFDTEMDLLTSGPVIHTWEGIVQAEPKEIRFDRPRGDFYFSGVWTNSCEAEEHLSFNPPAAEPVCWSLMGLASGWCTALFGSPVIAIEPQCVGKEDAHCEWLIQPVAAWEDKARPYHTAYQPSFDHT